MADTPQRPRPSPAKFPLDSLLEQMLAEAREEYGDGLAEGRIETLATELWNWSQMVKGSAIRLRPGESNTLLLEATGADRPFLVDSLLGVCSEAGVEVRHMFHPIVDTEKQGRRSLIQIHLPDLTEAEQKLLLEEAEATLADVVAATSDYLAMRQKMLEAIERVRTNRFVPDDYRTEGADFLTWLGNEHFVFLGARDYTFATADDGSVLPREPEMVDGSNLGLLRDEERNVLNRGAEPLLLTEEIGAFLSEPEPVILAKATLSSRVHRRVPCDYIGVKHFDGHGRVIGETRFLGLYTSEAYNEPLRNIPLLRKRFEKVIKLSGAVPGTHNEKALSNILESWPRDELFQTRSEDLSPIMQGVLNLIGRPRVRLFVRPDRFRRFVSTMVFIPRDAYDTTLRLRIASTLEKAYNGLLVRFQPSFEGADLVRVQFEISLKPDAALADTLDLEREIAALCRTWNERFRSALMSADMTTEDRATASLFSGAFTPGYRDAFDAEEAVVDVLGLAQLSEQAPIRMRAYRREADGDDRVRAKIYSRTGAIALSDCVPIFERMGLFVSFETGYEIIPRGKPAPSAPESYWVHALSMRQGDGRDINLAEIQSALEEAFVAIWSGRAENDGFNALILGAGLTWREAALCRALCAYRHQTGLDPTRSTQIEALRQNPTLTRHLIDVFSARFDPTVESSLKARADRLKTLGEKTQTALKAVKSLEHDRVLRRLAALIDAIQRTNFFQTTKDAAPLPWISFKIASRELEDLPSPKPYREIFMASPEVEGVHCRFGPVARGGLRWSDRRDDFRTEVLDLVKAQQVKNAVIVPVGSKGGFYPKNPLGLDRKEAGIEAYKTFITSLLDLTDNLIDGDVRHPDNTVIWDGEDPYLVVAADKGTATFSDTANEISEGQGFWLGDAFASGGSAGYDHKTMGITARGAWEAVKRHFREIGKDIQSEPFTVIGCGDMSGDVFGNGMLLSKQIRLQAAFNHMHIFVDPDPQDPERLWEERQRMFDLPRSSWMDYDQSLLSEGGRIYDRSDKALELTPQIKSLTGLKADSVTPDELIHALLKTECELLWFGGIGTYIKASHESHSDAKDRGNDTLRVDGKQLRAKVIGEGANLGLTQAGRIEAAQNGVRLNTDAIDNSAGVDSSDHEVNIKILCTEAMRRGSLPRGERNTLLASMTDDVATHVLRHNYAQTGALSLMEASAKADHDALERLMLRLETRGVLDRTVEGLPDSGTMRERGENGHWLTRPELAVIMAWTKIVLFDDLVASNVPDDPAFNDTLKAYFPTALHTYPDAMAAHRLKRDIIATVLANRIIDVSGPVFLLRLIEQSQANGPQIVLAFEAARDLIGAADLQTAIDALDNKVPAQRQTALEQALASSLLRMTLALLEASHETSVDERIERYGETVKMMITNLPEGLSKFETQRFERRCKQLTKDGVPSDLAGKITTTEHLAEAPLIKAIAERSGRESERVYKQARALTEALSLDRLQVSAEDAIVDMPYWDRLATRRLLQDLGRQRALMVEAALGADSADTWLTDNKSAQSTLVACLKTYRANQPGFSQFALAADAVRSFVQTTT